MQTFHQCPIKAVSEEAGTQLSVSARAWRQLTQRGALRWAGTTDAHCVAQCPFPRSARQRASNGSGFTSRKHLAEHLCLVPKMILQW